MTVIAENTEVQYSTKVLTLEALACECARLRAAGLAVVAAGGCFDLLHLGHVRTLQAARRLGDHLIVMVNSDSSVRQLKGPDRPIIPEDARAELLAALECVSYVIIFDETSPAGLLTHLQPTIFCKGADYAPPNGKPLPEEEVRAVASYGGRIEYLPLIPQNSTTSIVGRIQERAHA